MRTKLLFVWRRRGLLVAAASPVMAHHAFGGEFDANRPVLLKGKVDEGRMGEPARVDSHRGDRSTWPARSQGDEEWMVEGGTPNTLLRRGITRDSLKVGTEIVVDGYQSEDHSLLRANGRNITFTDGRKLFMGSSGTGAPKDGADPTEPPKPAAADAAAVDDQKKPRISQ